MSFNNFIPEVWAAQIERDRERASVAIKNCNREFEGEIKEAGDTVRIQTVTRPTVSDYVKDSTSITPQNLQGASIMLKVDQAKYYAFEVDDIDKRQAKGNVMDALKAEASAAMADVVDSYIYGLVTGVATSYIVSAASITSATVFSTIMSALQKLWVNNVPKTEEIVLEVSPAFYAKLVMTDILKDTDNSSVISSGYIGKVLGMPVYMTNGIYNDGTYDYCVARTKKAIAFASSLTKVEAYRPESSFADAIKGLDVYGAKIIRPKELVVIKASYGSETTI